MKKQIVLMLCLSILLVSVFAFTSCDNDTQSVKISIYKVNNGILQDTPELVLQKKQGDLFSKQEYWDSATYGDDDTYKLGFYTDKECRIKYDEDSPVTEDIDLYLDCRLAIGTSTNFCYIVFVFDGTKYQIYRDFSEFLRVNDFIVSAYGKNIEANSLRFYWDEECTDEFDIEHSGKIITLNTWRDTPGNLTIYVKHVTV